MKTIVVPTKTQKIAQYVRKQIQKGKYKLGEKIPSAVALSSQFGVNKDTVNAALLQMVTEGLVYRTQGSGTFVSTHTRSKSLAALFNDIADTVCPRILRGFEDFTMEKGYSVIVCNTDENSGKQEKYLEKVRTQRVAGLAIVPICFEKVALKHYLSLVKAGIPFVFMNRYVAELDSDYVVVDNTLGAYRAVSHLIRLGHRRIAYIALPRYSIVDQRLEGYKRSLEDHGIFYDKSLVRIGRSAKERPGHKYMKEFLKSKNGHTAVFTFNDTVAYDAYRAVIEAGLKVPDDIALVGFDDSEIAKTMEVPLTTVAYPAYEVGRVAAELLIKRIQERQGQPQHIVLEPELIIREKSSAK